MGPSCPPYLLRLTSLRLTVFSIWDWFCFREQHWMLLMYFYRIRLQVELWFQMKPLRPPHVASSLFFCYLYAACADRLEIWNKPGGEALVSLFLRAGSCRWCCWWNQVRGQPSSLSWLDSCPVCVPTVSVWLEGDGCLFCCCF